jgi:predicted homoserine dehydrogenase-like protein
MRVLKEALYKRQEQNEPINVAVIGSGWFGSGVIREFYHWPAITPRLVLTRTVERAIQSLRHAGVQASEIADVKSDAEYKNAISKEKYIVSNNLEIIKDLKGIDIVFEATGDVAIGAECGVHTIQQGIHYLTANIEMDGTIGFAVDELAREKGVVYSAGDGDQPGVILRMLDEVELYGFKVIVAGSCKGFMDPYQTPDGVLPWVRKGHNAHMVSAFADGTKQGLEMAVLANGTGLVPDICGMHGPTTTKETLVEDFLKVIKQEGIVDYVMGIESINAAAGVFVVAKREDKYVAEDLDYLKKGKGPYYLFFRDHHLCYYETAKSIAEAALFKISTLPHKKKMADVFAVAKKDLKKGEHLDGIGGFTVYGLIDRAEIIREKNLVPVGLTQYAVLKTPVTIDTPITYDMVEFPEDNVPLRLREKENLLVKQDHVQR